MKLTSEEACNVIWGDTEDWKPASDKNIDGTSRWSVFMSQVFEHIPTGKFYLFEWSKGATECQDEDPFEYVDEVEPSEVVEKEVTVKKWVAV